MKNQILFSAAQKMLQNRANKMAQQELYVPETCKELSICLKTEYENSNSRSNINMIFYLLFGVDFVDFISIANIDADNAKLEQETNDFEEFIKKEKNRDWPQEFYHAKEEEFIRCLFRFEDLKSKKISDKEIDIHNDFNEHLESLMFKTVSLNSDNVMVETLNIITKPKKNIDNEIIRERIAQLKIVKARLLSLPKEKRADLQQTEEMINRLKTWLN